jgi:four helix bundle protein
MGESFRNLIAWQKSIQLTVAVYKLTDTFPQCERFELCQQSRAASVSVSGNLAEGFGRGSRNEYRHFVGVARGSCCEVESHLATAKALGFGDAQMLARAESMAIEVSKLIHRLYVSLTG